MQGGSEGSGKGESRVGLGGRTRDALRPGHLCSGHARDAVVQQRLLQELALLRRERERAFEGGVRHVQATNCAVGVLVAAWIMGVAPAAMRDAQAHSDDLSIRTRLQFSSWRSAAPCAQKQCSLTWQQVAHAPCSCGRAVAVHPHVFLLHLRRRRGLSFSVRVAASAQLCKGCCGLVRPPRNLVSTLVRSVACTREPN